MNRTKRLAIVLTLLLAAVGAAPVAASEQGGIVLAQAQAPAPDSGWLGNIKLEHVIAVGAGALAGDVLHGALGISGGAAMVIGGFVGYYVYVNYIEKQDGPTGRRINAVADDAKLYLVAARDSLFELSNELLRTQEARH